MMMLCLFGAVFLWMCFTLSNPESRAAARARHHPYDKIAGALAAGLLISLFF